MLRIRPCGFRQVHHVAGCSSLKEAAPDGGWFPPCAQRLEERLVPAITLAQAVSLAAADRLPVRLVKIDAQGMDLELLKATPPHALAAVQSISLELHKDTHACRRDSALLYRGRETCADAVRHMSSMGFRYMGHVGSRLNPAWRPPPRTGRSHASANTTAAEALRMALRVPKYFTNLLSPGGCPDDENASINTRSVCEIQAVFVNERGKWPVLDAQRELPFLDPPCEHCVEV